MRQITEKPAILIADDDASHRAMLVTLLGEWGYETFQARDGKQAVAIAAKEKPDLVLMDVRMPGCTGIEAMEAIKSATPDLPVIIMTAWSDVPAAVDAIRRGAWDYLTKPLDFAKLKIAFRNALAQAGLLKENASLAAAIDDKKHGLLGHAPAMAELTQMIEAIAPSEATVLITGESGTGKELAARAVHAASKRAAGPFVAVNCGAFTENLLASELFGHEKGAFTGADKKHAGLFSRASGGTIFLDEIGEMPMSMQVKLLRVLQEKEVLSVGGVRPEPVNCRVVAATNRDLREEVEKGSFREDLYYRLNVVSLHMPPLRERREDIPVLARAFAEKFALANNKRLSGISRDAEEKLLNWKWPGNVRELENTMERAVILMPGEYIGLRELPERMLESGLPPAQQSEQAEFFSLGQKGIPTLEEVEKNVILRALKMLGNNKTETAKALGITRKTLHAKLNRIRNGNKE